MGCIASREENDSQLPKTPKTPMMPKLRFGAFEQSSSEIAAKPFILNAIKKRDLILFEKTIKQHEVLSLQKIGLQTQQKTILHYIAEKDFAEGMALVIEYITEAQPIEAPQILNAKDTEGNTPLLTCCISNSWETMKVLLQYGNLIDKTIQNQAGKTALDVALEQKCSCVNLLTCEVSFETRTNTSIVMDQPNHINQSPNSISKVFSCKEDEIGAHPSDGLKSIRALTKERAKAKTLTRLSYLLEESEETAPNYVDNEFPHDMYSLINEDADDDLIEDLYTMKWVRSKDTPVLSKIVKIFDDIVPGNTSESLLAGCDLYYALAAMTEFPQRLLNIFTTTEANELGAYSVNFLVSGIPVEILLDDYFPCSEDLKLIFSKPITNELWFLLLEKAFAKLYGNYAQLENISLCEAFEVMTSMPSAQLQLKEVKEEELWKNMVDYDTKNYIVCAGRNQEVYGLNRILTISRTYQLNETRIVKLINHFGKIEWDGIWSKDSSRWTSEIRQELEYSDEETNCVYMEFSEFLEMFDYISVCYYSDAWVRNALDIQADAGEPEFIKFSVEEDMDVILSVHQKLPIFVEEGADYNVSPVEIILAEETSDKRLKGIAFGERNGLVGKPTVFASDDVKIRLMKGNYVARVKTYWTDDGEHDVTINLYSTSCLEIEQAEKDDYPDFLNRVYTDVGDDQFKRKFILNNKCEFGTGWAGSHLWIYAANKGDKVWKLRIFFDKMTNLKLNKTYKTRDNILEFTLMPNEKAVSYLKRINSETVELKWKFEQSWE